MQSLSRAKAYPPCPLSSAVCGVIPRAREARQSLSFVTVFALQCFFFLTTHRASQVAYTKPHAFTSKIQQVGVLPTQDVFFSTSTV